MKVKYRFSGWPYKVAAFVLAAVSLFVGAAGLYLGIGALCDDSFLEKRPYQETWRCRDAMETWAQTVANRYHARETDADGWARLLRDTDFRFILLDEASGQVMASYTEGLNLRVPENLGDNPYLTEYNYTMELEENYALFQGLYVIDFYFVYAEDNLWITSGPASSVEGLETAPDPEQVSYQVLCLLPQTLTPHSGDVIWERYQLQAFAEGVFPQAAVAFVCGLVALLFCWIFLCCQAGHRPGQEALASCWFDRIPLDLLLTVAILAGIGVTACFCTMVDAYSNTWLELGELRLIVPLLAAATMACGELVLGFFVSLAARVKRGRWWETTVIWHLLCWAWKLLRWVWRVLKRALRWLLTPLRRVGQICSGAFYAMGMAPRAGLVVMGAMGLDMILLFLVLAAWSKGFWIFLLLFYNLILLAAAIFAVGQMKQLREAAGRLAAGDLDYQLDTSRMYWEFKCHGDDLNAIAGGMNKAVEQRMKSERLKTELITNVSHDIKTPLTSIVNYVDLLQKPHTEAEGVQYLEVLDRQAKRLKRLTENLVEASKASTGNLPVSLAPTNVTELMNQAAAEYRERLEAGRLDLVLWLEEELTVMADGRLLWRVLDNLLSNVVKYALAGTRVYLTARKQEGRVTLAVKNISRDPLNVDADELMERFVRGDSARSTEGSGLGLNIARSLTQLQRGDFRLTVDGDLFKAEVILPAAQ